MIIKPFHDLIINLIGRIDANKACKVVPKDSVCVMAEKFQRSEEPKNKKADGHNNSDIEAQHIE